MSLDGEAEGLSRTYSHLFIEGLIVHVVFFMSKVNHDLELMLFWVFYVDDAAVLLAVAELKSVEF